MRSFSLIVRQPHDAVFNHDYRTINNEPKVDGTQAHQTGGNPSHGHQVGREHHRQRNCQCGHQSRSEIPQHDEQNNHDQRPTLEQIRLHGLQRPSDERGAVISDLNCDTFGKCRLNAFDSLLREVHHFARILADEHHDQSSHCFAATIASHSSLSSQRSDDNLGDIFQQDR